MDSDLVVGLPNGVCQLHNQARININGRTACLKCEAIAAKAIAAPAKALTDVDPGHEAMKAILKDKDVKIPEAPPEPTKESSKTFATTFEAGIKDALEVLEKLPMPKDLKQFKAVNKAVQQLKKLLPEQIL